LTGSGTSFQTGSPPLLSGQYIKIQETFHQIQTVNSDTSITLANTYNGATVTNISFQAGELFMGTFYNFSVMGGSSNPAIQIEQGLNIAMRNIGFVNTGNDGLNILNSTQVLIQGCNFTNNGNSAITIENSTKIGISTNIIKNPTFRGIDLVSQC
jgi:polygalacturonase